MEPLERRFVPASPVDLRLTLGLHRRGARDPTMRFSADGSTWRASRTPDGPTTIRLVPDGSAIRAQAWGPGRAWAIDQAPELVGAEDDWRDLAAILAGGGYAAAGRTIAVGRSPSHSRPSTGGGALVGGRLLRDLLARHPGIRIGRTRRVLEALVPAIIEQKVTGAEATTAFGALVRRHGEAAPGPWDEDGRAAALRLPPSADVLAGLPGYAYHPLGLERRRADAIRYAAARVARIEECSGLPLAEAEARLRALPLVGPWTTAEVGLRALGDVDAVSVGDFHLAAALCRALAGEEHGTDERMLELLAPYAGHRARVIRLIEVAGIHPPRRGPRMAPRSIAEI